MSEWRELKTLQDVAAAQAAGDEIEVFRTRGDEADGWYSWVGNVWADMHQYRARPRKKTKTVVLREALFKTYRGYYVAFVSPEEEGDVHFVRWLDTPERVVEIEE